MPPPQEYALGYAELQKLAEKVSQHATRFLLTGGYSVPFDRHHR